MRCPNCNSIDTSIIDSRYSKKYDYKKRVHACLHCITRFNTYEVAQQPTSNTKVTILAKGTSLPITIQINYKTNAKKAKEVIEFLKDQYGITGKI